MTLKQASKLAGQHGYSYIYVDENLAMFMSNHAPHLCEVLGVFYTLGESIFLGLYSGKKHWTKAMREVK